METLSNIVGSKNKMKKIFGYGLMFIALIGMIFSVSSVFAYKADPSKTGPNYSPERHDAMLKAFENRDYDSWYELMTKNGTTPGILNRINKDNFDLFVELREAQFSADLDKANELKAKLGLGQGMIRQKNKNSGNLELNSNNKNRFQMKRANYVNCPNLN